jgi:catecholate siderophore receptor
LLNPNPDDVYTGEIATSPQVGDLTGDSQAVYAFDTVQFGSHWEAMGGLRWERFDAEGMNISRSDVVPVSRVDSMPSVRAGLTYKPRESSSVYFSYGTSMDPSLEGLSYQSADDTLAPEKTYSLELGSKWETMQGRLLLSGALFQVEKTNARTPGVEPGDPATVLEGLQRVRGIELGATGNITRRWKVFGAYTLMDTRVVESNNPDELGRRIQNAPRNSFNIWTTYRVWKLEVGGGPRYVGHRFGNSTNSREVAGYWTVDGVVSYALTPRIDLRLNCYNLNNAYYFDRLGGGHVIPGPARSVMVGTGFRF